MRSVFDIIGPIMIGPSSSHTAGGVRIGLMAGKILGETIAEVHIALHGSFQATYRGHGTDKALVAGILGFRPDDECIRESLEIARNNHIKVSFYPVDLEEAHPNTAIIHLTGVSGKKLTIQGASVGGGNILITNIDGYEVELSGTYPALITIHHDMPGVITKVTGIIARYELNIAFMSVSRKKRGESAMMIIQLDDQPSDELMEDCCQVYGVESAMSIPSI
ncbi:L-serine ammonia-lyase, iron-sulfur-dependent subunit beta [Selenomonas sp. TAMA-11512]|uniref:L-serine ammonia-lyase, iron-sulfur-dependent subunit beta n=1 Tax=Selenomonas sp. TAMA-11512 TaxID=3095337 RepID=UPI003087ADF4|nr:L-serine ammonia-lyase, iron-sulfur-dependent subunit beta [Selenomonas sp. TAMA-11512]